MGKRMKASGYRTRLSDFRSLRLPALCVFFALGAVLGLMLARFLGADSELADKLCSYAVLNTEATGAASLFAVVSLYFRFPLMMLLFGYYGFGVIAIPLALLLQGFTLSFASASLGAALGRQGVVLALAALGIRGLLTVACTLLLAIIMLDRMAVHSENGQKSYGKIIALCFLVLALGVILELTIVPMLFSSALEMLR